jgi:hypothetical protein
MWFIRAMQSPIGRIAKLLVAVWCFSVGSVEYTLGGLMLMMLAVVLGATAIARVSLVEEAVKAWRSRHGMSALGGSDSFPRPVK